MAMLFHKAMLADFDGCGQQRNEESTRNPSRVELFFQIDWRLGLLMDLQLASQTPSSSPSLTRAIIEVVRNRFAQFAWVVLGFNLLVILWGALVRASKSGEGCGDQWPLCNGTVVPHAAQIATIIEFTHRASTGLALISVVAMAIWAWRVRRNEPTVRMAVASLVFIVMEALLGAGLVLFKYVGTDASLGRAVYLSAHLLNTLLMLGAFTLTAWYGSGHGPIDWRAANAKQLAFALVASLAIAVTGAVTALSDTLYPVTSLQAGLAADFSGTAPMLLRLRIWHPMIAAVAGVYIALVAAKLGGKVVVSLVLLQTAAGVLNLTLLAPIWMQLVHLLLADLLWIALVLLTAAALEQPAPQPATEVRCKPVLK